jgi:hypothetical protein
MRHSGIGMMMFVPGGRRYPVALCYGILVDFELSSGTGRHGSLVNGSRALELTKLSRDLGGRGAECKERVWSTDGSGVNLKKRKLFSKG